MLKLPNVRAAAQWLLVEGQRTQAGHEDAVTDYVLHIPDAMEGQLRGFNAGVRQAIQHKLNEIAQEATARAKDLPVVLGPPLRFYVYEGYRISYSVDPVSRRIVVQDLRRVPA